MASAFASALALCALLQPPRAIASPQEEILRRDYAIAGFKLPPRWETRPRDRASYPQLLGWAARGQGPDQAIITLVAKRLPPFTTLAAFVDETLSLKTHPRVQNLRLLPQRSLPWHGGQRMQVDALLAAGPNQRAQVMRQLMFMNPPFGYVLTLVAPVEQATARYREFEDTAESLAPLPIEHSPAAPTPPAPTPPAPTPAAPAPAAPGTAPAPAAAPTPTAPPGGQPAPPSRPDATPGIAPAPSPPMHL